MNTYKGRLIVFEGVDAVGKTSLCGHTCALLDESGVPYILQHFPGRNDKATLGELVYKVHHQHETEFGIPTIDPLALQALHVAAHIDIIKSKIIPAINAGISVVLDRFWWSTYVYGLSSGIPAQQLKALINVEKLVWGNMEPDLIVLVDADKPLRKDELNTEIWHKKRHLYNTFTKNLTEANQLINVRNEPQLSKSEIDKKNITESKAIFRLLYGKR